MKKKEERMAARVAASEMRHLKHQTPWYYSADHVPPFGFEVVSCIPGQPLEMYCYLPEHAAEWQARPRFWMGIPAIPLHLTRRAAR